MVAGGIPRSGALYALPAKLVISGVGCSNGLGWSPDGATIFYVDSHRRTIDALDYDVASAAAGKRRTIVQVTDATPDGLCVDEDGCLWVPMWDGGCVRRFDPSGQLMSTVELPVLRPTAVCLVRTVLVITTERRAAAPLSGHLFAVDVGVAGPRLGPGQGRWTSMFDAMCVGESMVLLAPDPPRPLGVARQLQFGMF